MDQNLINYMKSVVYLQKQSFMQSQTIQQLDNKINSLGWYSNIQRQEAYRDDKTVSVVIYVLFIGAPLLGIIFAIAGFKEGCISGAIGGALKGILIGVGVTVVIGLISK